MMNSELLRRSIISENVVHFNEFASPIQDASRGADQFNLGSTAPPKSVIAALTSFAKSGNEGRLQHFDGQQIRGAERAGKGHQIHHKEIFLLPTKFHDT